MKLQELLEKYLGGSRQPLYHWTDLLGYENILKWGAISNRDDYDAINGYKKLKKGYVSFTRDQKYQIGGDKSSVRFDFDWDKLKNSGYKTKEFSYPFPTSGDDWTPIKNDKRRVEAEQLVMGPVYLKDGLIQICITKAGKTELEKNIAIAEKALAETDKLRQYIKKDKFIEDAYKTFMGPNSSKETWERLAAHVERDDKWRPAWFTETGCDAVDVNSNARIKKYEDLIKKVKLI